MKPKICFVLLALAGISLQQLSAEVRLPSIFSDHAVLQKSDNVPVWGTADPEEKVTVSLAGTEKETTTGSDGKWKVILDLKDKGKGPYELIVEGKNKIVLADILVGQVWLCSGQSNMGFVVKNSVNGKAEVDSATDTQIRLFKVGRNAARAPAEDVKGVWQVCSPQTVADFSAVGYFFGRELRKRVDAPVGLIDSSWGGTPAEAWTPVSDLESEPDFAALLTQRKVALASDPSASIEKEKKAQTEWAVKIDQLLAAPGHPEKAWFNPATPAEGWKAIRLPGSIDNQIKAGTDGSFWIRKVVDVPESAAQEQATLYLGAIDDYDFTWVNGNPVGKMGKENPNAYKTDREYPLPAGTLQAGKNVILVRVIDSQFLATVTGDIRLENASGWKVSLAGNWEGRLETDLGASPATAAIALQNISGTLYDGMIFPLVPYAIHGVIWYQGESNAGRAVEYRKLFPQMISSWRKVWDRGNFPFYFVQLANFMARNPIPVESGWAELREAQSMTLKLPQTGMAVIIDIGEEKDIHPKNKQEVGRRLALIALSKDYGITVPGDTVGGIPLIGKYFYKPLIFSGPIFKSMSIEGSKVRLHFDNGGSALVNKNPAEALQGFSLAGKDGIFVWADAVIAGDSVIVSSTSVTEPFAVRYGWADNPAVSLYNAEGLPASPFRTDSFAEITRNKP